MKKLTEVLEMLNKVIEELFFIEKQVNELANKHKESD